MVDETDELDGFTSHPLLLARSRSRLMHTACQGNVDAYETRGSEELA